MHERPFARLLRPGRSPCLGACSWARSSSSWSTKARCSVFMTLLRGAFGDQEQDRRHLAADDADPDLRRRRLHRPARRHVQCRHRGPALPRRLCRRLGRLRASAAAPACTCWRRWRWRSLAGAAWVAIPAYFRARYNTNEVVSTILSNYVAVLLTSYFTIFLFKRPGGWSETPPILATAYLPEIFSFSRLNWGLVDRPGAGGRASPGLPPHQRAAIGLTMVGSAPKFAEYGGVDVKRQGFCRAARLRAPSAGSPAASRRSACITASWKALRPASASTG